MKICIYSDVHWSVYSSIVRKRGAKYSVRLENIINSLNWVYQTAVENDCSTVFCLGDFFDQESLNSEEITALKELKFTDIPTVFLVGNHEIGRGDLSFNSTDVFDLAPNSEIVNTAKSMIIDNTEICLLPYTLEEYRKSIAEYFGKKSTDKRIILSHNDLLGIQMGPVISRSGFDVEDALENCDLFINGHLHNSYEVKKSKIIDIGNITGQNFSEDCTKYSHHLIILDTNTLEYKYVENPYALNFMKLDVCENDNYTTVEKYSNVVLSIRCYESAAENIRNYLSNAQNVVEYRLVVVPDPVTDSTGSTNVEETQLLPQIDHLKQFYDYINQTLDMTEIVSQELSEVLK